MTLSVLAHQHCPEAGSRSSITWKRRQFFSGWRSNQNDWHLVVLRWQLSKNSNHITNIVIVKWQHAMTWRSEASLFFVCLFLWCFLFVCLFVCLFFNQLTASILKNRDPNTQKVSNSDFNGTTQNKCKYFGQKLFSSNGLTCKRWKIKILYLSCFGAGVSGSPMIGKRGLLRLKMCIMFCVVLLKPVFLFVCCCLFFGVCVCVVVVVVVVVVNQFVFGSGCYLGVWEECLLCKISWPLYSDFKLQTGEVSIIKQAEGECPYVPTFFQYYDGTSLVSCQVSLGQNFTGSCS